MTSAVLDRMLQRAGRNPATFDVRSVMGRAMRDRGVQTSPDLERVINLPRRSWQEDPDLEQFTGNLTAALKTPRGTWRLHPIQAVCLQDLYIFGGLLGIIGVGDGKTLIGALAPTVLRSERPLMVIPAKHINTRKTQDDLDNLRLQFRIPREDELRLKSYEALGRVSGSTFLDEYRPDLLIFDEGHYLKNKSGAAVTRRVRRYVKAARKAGRHIVVLIMSGTITDRSLHDYHHLLELTLPELLPLPHHELELRTWADAIDEKVDPLRRMRPGALEQLYNTTERNLSFAGQGLRAVRLAYGRRLVSTPGIVASTVTSCASSISIEVVEPTYKKTTKEHVVPCMRCEQTGKFGTSACSTCAGKGCFRYTIDIEGAFKRLREKGETPDGQPVADGASEWRHARELACGFFYRWHPYPPVEWLEPRKAWYKFVRHVIGHGRSGLDSELQVANANRENKLYLDWVAARDLYDPEKHKQAVWVDEGALTMASEWDKKHGPGLIWVEHRAVGKRLSERTGLPFCSTGGADPKGLRADKQDPRKSVICSVQSIGEGYNMQAWSRNLVLSAKPNGSAWEQMLGRTHRQNQKADLVEVWMMLACIEQVKGFQQAVRDAHYKHTTTTQEQRLIKADVLVDFSKYQTRKGERWQKAA